MQEIFEVVLLSLSASAEKERLTTSPKFIVAFSVTS